MSKEKQIEEMANIISSKINGANFDDVSDAVVALYDAGYRKQSVGEWIEHRHTRPYEEVFYLCSECGRKVYQKEPYCHCDARRVLVLP